MSYNSQAYVSHHWAAALLGFSGAQQYWSEEQSESKKDNKE